MEYSPVVRRGDRGGCISWHAGTCGSISAPHPGVGKTYAMLERGSPTARTRHSGAGRVRRGSRPPPDPSHAGRARGRPSARRRAPRHPARRRWTSQRSWPDTLRSPWSTSSRTRTLPDSRHAKRWQDVETLLDAGIDVITTVNVQHLESLNDTVAAITGTRQNETVPDRVVRAADQIELVDMSPEALRRRLAHGNVYAPGKVDAALSNYFRVGNLTALRELALLWVADRVEEGPRALSQRSTASRTSWPARERVVVALTGGPEGDTLIRRGARIAGQAAGGELLAVHVVADDGLVGS